jgi:hypothetical protein
MCVVVHLNLKRKLKKPRKRGILDGSGPPKNPKRRVVPERRRLRRRRRRRGILGL